MSDPIKPGDAVQVGSVEKDWIVSKVDGENAVCIDGNGRQENFPLVTLTKKTAFNIRWEGRKR